MQRTRTLRRRQNRVTPLSDLLATSHRGTLTGNRGVLHDAHGQIQRPWQGKRWIICLLAFKDRQRQVMTPGRYTELFFLDEATALAAGHRPCAECQRERFDNFRQAWRSAQPLSPGSPLPTAGDIDQLLHAERVGPDRAKRLYQANLTDMPNGVFVQRADWGDDTYLVWNDGLHCWSAGGYTGRRKRPKAAEIRVVTPASTVGVIRAGYVPVLHPSARV